MPRRTLLAGCAAGVLAGCTSGSGAGGGAGGVVSGTGLRRRAARDSSALLARYDATAVAHPALAGALGPLRESVAAHVAALAGAGGTSPDGAAGGDAAAPAPAGAAPEVPGEPERALQALIDAERAMADQRLRALAGAPPELARLLASLAAAGAAQAHLLSEARP
ncbi:hypothetical protein RM780_25125 [Streptomyces sp. DSM 44917]|uniref:Lipoprotein n=1 Tax=Streptomyces boetiae TaxID=3075541 RepID=A0ABU2LF62_9ACTN|nr:hypothetical protein [Streptomyces sp. DSM 44917]MDT0310209.1 hypothetical protein [Streptomyces sp. DSM 44917]